ncbi:hypothetical protein M8818_007170 [Zalaria obscura]|uniref:Uncharacterized protein n=1 Tax=Zalaria obscura TaxID=2024903 RepID=A0ACC3S4N3_9PEZI
MFVFYDFLGVGRERWKRGREGVGMLAYGDSPDRGSWFADDIRLKHGQRDCRQPNALLSAGVLHICRWNKAQGIAFFQHIGHHTQPVLLDCLDNSGAWSTRGTRAAPVRQAIPVLSHPISWPCNWTQDEILRRAPP